MHGIKVLMAKNYIDNLSEEARKGMQEKAEQGIWPTKTPLGYRNVTGPNGKKIIGPDPESAPLITRLFEWYATGTLSLKEAAQKVRAAGLVHRRSGAQVPVSTVHTVLRNRLYTGGVRVERPPLPGTARAARFAGAVGAGAGYARRSPCQEASARRAGSLPARDRAAPICRPVLHGRRRSASRTCTERAAALPEAGTSGEAAAPQFPGFELLMDGRRTDLNPAPTSLIVWHKQLPSQRRRRRTDGRNRRRKERVGWGGRIRTCECRIQSPVPYRLATPHGCART